MLNLPFSKLKIKIHALDNPTSVFKKRNLLSLNCINKSSPKKKNITPIRTNPNDIYTSLYVTYKIQYDSK